MVSVLVLSVSGWLTIWGAVGVVQSIGNGSPPGLMLFQAGTVVVDLCLIAWAIVTIVGARRAMRTGGGDASADWRRRAWAIAITYAAVQVGRGVLWWVLAMAGLLY